MKIIGDTGRPTLWVGRIVDLSDDDAASLVWKGMARPLTMLERMQMQSERRANPMPSTPPVDFGISER